MRGIPRWLSISVVLFAAYLLALGVFVSRQLSVQSRHIVWTKQLASWNFGKTRLLSDGRLLVQDYSGMQLVFSPAGEKLYEVQGPSYGNAESEGLYRELPNGEAYIVTEGPLNQQHTGGGMANVVITSSGTPEITRIDADGRELARIKPGFVFDSNTGLLPIEGQIVLSDASRQIQAVDESGNTAWQCTTTVGQLLLPGPDSGMLSADVNSISQTAELALIDKAGQQLWLKPLPGDFGSSLLCDGERIYYVDNSGDIRCLDADGNELWQFAGNGSVFAHDGPFSLSSRGPWMDNAEVLQLTADGRLAAMDEEGGLHLLDCRSGADSVVNLPYNYSRKLAVDTQRGRIVSISDEGLEVFDMQGRRLSNNSFIRGRGRPVLDTERSQGYVYDNGRLSCFSY
ncbi:MAG: PQQ-binding-like beta-propeller repeat protein [Planctomycetales bacterium]|nr:PQQ-binding-like beta-propeller repeat protein [bacterium]UNM09527.1 MAG: PQQ-binding-like beta-propeller repeat protein [Planctomycetales bacterium]